MSVVRFLKSRTAAELQKRADYIIKVVERENEQLREKAKSKPTKKAAAPAAQTAGNKRKAETPAKASHKKKR